ncbi:MAG: serine/threonine protein kinase [Polyangiaceae bacterium]|nr:serine/threonine protein kinase [Polyangiaceae bacterium]
MSETLSPSMLFAGRYRIVRPLKSGGMGTVYEAEHAATSQRVALKTMRPEIVASRDLQTRFAQEARVSSIIQSRHVVGVTDAGVEGGVPFLVMEFLRGKELGDVLAGRGTLPAGQVVAIMNQLAKGLDKAHAAGVVHRDMKPENLFLTRDEDGELLVKILDFGIAKLIQGVSNTTTAGGTPTYMAPEQTKKGSLSQAVDIWAFGLIAFRMLAGRTFWDADSVGELYGEILAPTYPPPSQRSPVPLPSGFEAFFSRCVANDPAARFASAGEAARALAEVAGPPDTNLKDVALSLLGPEPLSTRDAARAASQPYGQMTELAPGAGGTVMGAPIEVSSAAASVSGTVAGLPVGANAEGSTQLSAAAPALPRPPMTSSSGASKGGSRVVLYLVAALALIGVGGLGVAMLTGKDEARRDDTSAKDDEEDDEDESDRPKRATSAKSRASASSAPIASASSVAPPPASAPTSDPSVATAPTDEEWAQVPREVAVYGSTKLGCETKALREWLRVRCSGTNDTGGTPKGVSIVKGDGKTFVASDGSELRLLLRFEEGTDMDAIFEWTDKSARLRSVWVKGAPRPPAYGNFLPLGGAAAPASSSSPSPAPTTYDFRPRD